RGLSRNAARPELGGGALPARAVPPPSAAENEARAVARDGVDRPRGSVDEAAQHCDLLRIAAILRGPIAELAGVVLSPGPDRPVAADGERKTRARRNAHDVGQGRAP